MTSAYPLAVYRILVAMMSLVYFGQAFLEFDDFGSDHGLLDHPRMLRVFWFTSFNFVQNGTVLLFTLALGACASAGLLLGWRTKACALTALVCAVGYFRWIFPVANLNDASVQMHLLWVLLLPTGETLSWPHFRSDRSEMVSDQMLRFFFANLFLYYLVTGLSKWSSLFWRHGIALYCVLRSPLARTSTLWHSDALPFTAVFNYATLFIEPLLPFIALLPAYHRWKWVGGLCWAGLHVGIIATIGVEYANFGQLIALILVFRQELSGVPDQPAPARRPLTGPARFAVSYLILLSLAMSKGIPGLQNFRLHGFSGLWMLGLAQEYHLFDWIDDYNFVMESEVLVNGRKVDSSVLWPRGLRGFIVQFYLQGRRWMHLPRPLTGELRRSLWQRSAERFARQYRGPLPAEVRVTCVWQRIGPGNLDLERGRRFLGGHFLVDSDGVRMLVGN